MGSREEIRAAMERLLNGDAQHTDGRLTKTNLAVEAGVGRATLYRQHDLMAEWARRVTESDIATRRVCRGHDRTPDPTAGRRTLPPPRIRPHRQRPGLRGSRALPRARGSDSPKFFTRHDHPDKRQNAKARRLA